MRPSARRCWTSIAAGVTTKHKPVKEAKNRAHPSRREFQHCMERRRFPVLAAFDLCLKCSHLFNILDARGAISVTERVGVIARIRMLAVGVAKAYVDQQKAEEDSAPASEENGSAESGAVVGGGFVGGFIVAPTLSSKAGRRMGHPVDSSLVTRITSEYRAIHQNGLFPVFSLADGRKLTANLLIANC